MTGQWIRIDDVLLLDELGWHRVDAVVEIKGDLEGRARIELVCHAVVVVQPEKIHRGLPMTGNTICAGCIGSKNEEAT